jgi:hypothetical protein
MICVIPGPEAHSHDDAFWADWSGASLANLRLGLRSPSDASIFHGDLWMPYGGWIYRP